jgi:hypothetical protein
VLPRRLGVRFALEALFLVLLALAAGLAGLRPLYIVVVMAGAWLLVALAELTAERIERSPLTYLLPSSPPAEEEDEPKIFGPRPEERTVVAPPSSVPEQQAEVEPEPEPAPEPVPEPEPEPEPVTEPKPEPEPPSEEKAATLEPSLAGWLRSRLRRKEPEPEPAPSSQPRHVKLLPRRSAPEPSRASQEVAELFGARPREDEDGTQEEAKR